MKTNQLNILRWFTRVISLVMFVLGLMFYFGYGNPLPFVNPDYTWIENTWLILVPFAFIGLVVGLKYEKLGGYLVIFPIIIGFLLGLLSGINFPMNLLVVLIPGILYLVYGYQKK